MPTTIEIKRWWVSWVCAERDYRPIHDPPNIAILGWWCSGYSSEDNAILCACVRESEDRLKETIKKDWPEFDGEFRFCDECDDNFIPGDRFPLNEWMKRRFLMQMTPDGQ